jgi:hypothetical protein
MLVRKRPFNLPLIFAGLLIAVSMFLPWYSSWFSSAPRPMLGVEVFADAIFFHAGYIATSPIGILRFISVLCNLLLIVICLLFAYIPDTRRANAVFSSIGILALFVYISEAMVYFLLTDAPSIGLGFYVGGLGALLAVVSMRLAISKKKKKKRSAPVLLNANPLVENSD